MGTAARTPEQAMVGRDAVRQSQRLRGTEKTPPVGKFRNQPRTSRCTRIRERSEDPGLNLISLHLAHLFTQQEFGLSEGFSR